MDTDTSLNGQDFLVSADSPHSLLEETSSINMAAVEGNREAHVTHAVVVKTEETTSPCSHPTEHSGGTNNDLTNTGSIAYDASCVTGENSGPILDVDVVPPPYTCANAAICPAEIDQCEAIDKKKVKTVLCVNYMHGRRCRFGTHCAFAHGEEELRASPPEMIEKKRERTLARSMEASAAKPPPHYSAMPIAAALPPPPPPPPPSGPGFMPPAPTRRSQRGAPNGPPPPRYQPLHMDAPFFPAAASYPYQPPSPNANRRQRFHNNRSTNGNINGTRAQRPSNSNSSSNNNNNTHAQHPAHSGHQSSWRYQGDGWQSAYRAAGPSRPEGNHSPRQQGPQHMPPGQHVAMINPSSSQHHAYNSQTLHHPSGSGRAGSDGYAYNTNNSAGNNFDHRATGRYPVSQGYGGTHTATIPLGSPATVYMGHTTRHTANNTSAPQQRHRARQA